MSGSGASPGRWRPTWLHWTIAVLVVVAGTPPVIALAIRQHGVARLDEVERGLRARGEPTTLDDFAALAPPLDRERQRLWWAWQDDLWHAPGADRLAISPEAVDVWQRGAAMPDAVLARFAALDARMERGRALLRTDPVGSMLGWFAEDFPPGSRSAPAVFSTRMPNLLALRAAAQWLQARAWQDADPHEALTDATRLRATLERPATLIDAMIAIALDRIRDETFLRLAWRGRIGDGDLQEWLDEPPAGLHAVADALVGERVLFVGSYARWERAHPSAAADMAGSSRVPGWRTAKSFLFAQSDSAQIIAGEAALVARLRDPRLPTPDLDHLNAHLRCVTDLLPNLMECCRSAEMRDTLHRLARIAARICARWRGRSAPAGLTEVVTGLGEDPFAGGGDALRLTYEQLSPTRVRVRVDPSSPIPDFDSAARYAVMSAATKPPLPAIVFGQTWIDVELPPAP